MILLSQNKNPLTLVIYKIIIPHCTLAVQGLLMSYQRWLLSLMFWSKFGFSLPIGSSVVM